jgi:hypothetical protein
MCFCEAGPEVLNISHKNYCCLEDNTCSYVPMIGHLETGFPIFLCLQANAEMARKFQVDTVTI